MGLTEKFGKQEVYLRLTGRGKSEGHSSGITPLYNPQGKPKIRPEKVDEVFLLAMKMWRGYPQEYTDFKEYYAQPLTQIRDGYLSGNGKKFVGGVEMLIDSFERD